MKEYYVNQNLLINLENFNWYIFWTGFVWSNISLNLVKTWIWKLYLYDVDKIEAKNISNQLYTKKQIWKEKTSSLKNNLSFFNINTTILEKTVNLEKIDSKQLVFNKENNLIFISVDDNNLRKKIYNDLKDLKIENSYIIDIRTNQDIVYIKTFKFKKENILENIELLNKVDKYDEENICWIKNTFYYGSLISWLVLENIWKIYRKEKFYKEIIYMFKEMYLECK